MNQESPFTNLLSPFSLNNPNSIWYQHQHDTNAAGDVPIWIVIVFFLFLAGLMVMASRDKSLF